MSKKNQQVQSKRWRSDFGDDYIQRNQPTEEIICARVRAFSEVFERMSKCPETILECGANVGLNLRALRRITTSNLFAVEPNAKAREQLVADKVLPRDHINDSIVSDLSFADASMDLVFTAAVLIHVPDEGLEKSMSEIYRVSSQYILSMEYFSPKPETISYQGYDDMLFKRDYGRLWLENYPELELLGYGFFWKQVTTHDDITWWLFRKT